MKIIENNILPPKGFNALNIFGVLFARKGKTLSERTVRHEAIHTRQMRELLFVPFYIFYALEWLVKLCVYGKQAYRNISFEREAYANEGYRYYLDNRKHFAFLKYVF